MSDPNIVQFRRYTSNRATGALVVEDLTWNKAAGAVHGKAKAVFRGNVSANPKKGQGRAHDPEQVRQNP